MNTNDSMAIFTGLFLPALIYIALVIVWIRVDVNIGWAYLFTQMGKKVVRSRVYCEVAYWFYSIRILAQTFKGVVDTTRYYRAQHGVCTRAALASAMFDQYVGFDAILYPILRKYLNSGRPTRGHVINSIMASREADKARWVL